VNLEDRIDARAAELAEQIAELRAEVARLAAAAERAPALLDRKGLARALGVSPATIDRMRADGMPELRVCDAPRFELARALEWLRERNEAAPSTARSTRTA
jgi:hypothetical protein